MLIPTESDRKVANKKIGEHYYEISQEADKHASLPRYDC